MRRTPGAIDFLARVAEPGAEFSSDAIVLACSDEPARTESLAVGYYHLFNAGAETAYIRVGDASVLATVSDIPVPPRAYLPEPVLIGGPKRSYLSGVCPGGRANLYLVRR